jgi:hypothetical protein
VSREVAEKARAAAKDVDKFRWAFLVYAILMHEMSHQLLRRTKLRDSPKSLMGLRGRAEAGEFLELKLFGGVILSTNGRGDISGGLKLQRKGPRNAIQEFKIKDSFIITAVCLSGTHFLLIFRFVLSSLGILAVWTLFRISQI